jgi:site-specific DNA-methyltransferase (adenine-specific)
MAVRIEDAGFEIRDMIAWVYGSGFPKSLDVSKAIDKAAGAEREVVNTRIVKDIRRNVEADLKQGKTDRCGKFAPGSPSLYMEYNLTAPETDAARQWSGWGTALKPALEPITVARKPLIGTVAENVQAHGTGAINVDGCRVGAEPPAPRNAPKKIIRGGKFHAAAEAEREMSHFNPTQGRWPANLIHDGSEEVTELLSDAARFFYCAKASKRDRGDGNRHPTVKPTDLMRYLCRLVTPPSGTILDPFTGSGSTGKAAMLEGFQFIGIEREAEYVEIAKARIEAVKK